MPSCNTYHLTWVSLTLGVGYLHGCSSKAQPLLLTLDEGYLLTTAVPDLQCGIAPLGPPVPAQPPLLGLLLPASGPGLGLRVAPQGHRPWPRTRGVSSRPPLTSDAGYLLSAMLSAPAFPRSWLHLVRILSYLGLIGMACCLCLAGHCRQKCPIWPQEKHFLFVESFLLRLFFFLSFFFYFGSGESPLRGFSPRSRLCILCTHLLSKLLCSKNFLPFSALGNALGGFGGKVGNS